MPNVVALRAAPRLQHPLLGEELLTVARCLGKLAEDTCRSDLSPRSRAAVMASLSQAACALQAAADAIGKDVEGAIVASGGS